MAAAMMAMGGAIRMPPMPPGTSATAIMPPSAAAAGIPMPPQMAFAAYQVGPIWSWILKSMKFALEIPKTPKNIYQKPKPGFSDPIFSPLKCQNIELDIELGFKNPDYRDFNLSSMLKFRSPSRFDWWTRISNGEFNFKKWSDPKISGQRR